LYHHILLIQKESVCVLDPITALGGTSARVDTVAGVTLREITDLSLASVSARNGHSNAVSTGLRDLLGVDAPMAGRAVLTAPYSAVWMGPDQWMLGADFTTHEDIEARLKTHFGAGASITEQTDAWCAFDLTGDGITAVIELCCNINLSTIQAGDATRSSIHHLGCFVICGDPSTHLRILGPRASAGSLHHALLGAMVSAL
jgi:sarcosine oxidase subunit gamma